MSPAIHRPKIGKLVEVHANACVYRGILKDVTETEVYLKTEGRTWTIALANVRSLRYLDEIKKLEKSDAWSENTDPQT